MAIVANKGPMVRVELSPGRWVQMYRSDAVAQGLVEAPASKKKRRKAAWDKRRMPEGEKSPTLKEELEPAPEPEPTPDDLTEIPGVGDSTAAILQQELGVQTFDQLRRVDIRSLPLYAQRAIEEWRGEGD